jgi:hypothetical protein
VLGCLCVVGVWVGVFVCVVFLNSGGGGGGGGPPNQTFLLQPDMPRGKTK